MYLGDIANLSHGKKQLPSHQSALQMKAVSFSLFCVALELDDTLRQSFLDEKWLIKPDFNISSGFI